MVTGVSSITILEGKRLVSLIVKQAKTWMEQICNANPFKATDSKNLGLSQDRARERRDGLVVPTLYCNSDFSLSKTL